MLYITQRHFKLTLISFFFLTFGWSQEKVFIDQLIQKYEVPGLSIAILQDGKTVYQGLHGVKANDTHSPINENTIFEAASLSKPLFALAVLKLVEQGKLELDAFAHTYLPYDDIAYDERYKKITIRMLLSHQGGFPNWRNGQQLKILFEPGSQFQYSGEGFTYLTKIVEQLTGKSLNQVMQELIFSPLQMNRSSYIWKTQFDANYAAPHNNLGEPFSKRRPKQGNAAYSLQTTANDFAKALEALLGNQIINQEMLTQLSTPQIPIKNYQALGWGLGWGTQQTAKGNAIWQWGDNGNFKAFVMIYPESKTGLVYFTNSANGLKLIPDLTKLVFQDKCPAFKWMDYPVKDQPYQKLLRAILASDYDQAITPYLAKNQPHQDTSKIKEWQMNSIGYNLMNRKRFEDARKVFWANTLAYPNAANTYDSYAEVSLKMGDQKTAKEYYQKAYSMDSSYTTAQQVFRQLSTEKRKGNVTFRLRNYPYARLVTVAGSFNNWNSLSLPFVKENGEWVCQIDLEPGTYEYKLVIDGVWTIDPANMQTIESDGNINSVLLVEE